MKKSPIIQPKPFDGWSFAFLVPFLLFPACLVFFPDERVVRLKLQAVETLVFFWTLMSGCYVVLYARRPASLKSIYLPLGVLLWCVVMLGCWFISTERSLANMELRRVLLAASLFFCSWVSVFGQKQQRAFYGAWAFFSALIAVYSVLQKWGGIGMIDVPQMDRPMGTFGNPIFMAAFLVASVWISAAGFLSVSFLSAKAFFIGCILMHVASLGVLQTRAAHVAMAATVIFFVMSFQKKIPWKRVLVVLFLLGSLGIMSRSLWLRDQAHGLIWRDTLRMWAAHPVVGVGMGAFHTNFPQYAQDDLKSKWPQGQFIVNYAHSEIVQTLAETGLVGLLSFLLVLGLFVWRMRSIVREDHALRSQRLCLGLGAASLLIQNIFSVDMRFGWSFGLFFFLMALSAREDEGSFSLVNWSIWVKGLLCFVFIVFMGAAVFPRLLAPYRAQEKVRTQKDFFDERLLDPAKTVTELESLSLTYPNEASVWERLGYVCAKEMKTSDGKINHDRAQQAIKAYSRVLDIKPTHVSAMNNLGNIYYTLGRVSLAIEMWNKALLLQPDFLALRLNLGKVLYTQGRLKESALHLEEVLRLDPGNSEAIVYLKKMVE